MRSYKIFTDTLEYQLVFFALATFALGDPFDNRDSLSDFTRYVPKQFIGADWCFRTGAIFGLSPL